MRLLLLRQWVVVLVAAAATVSAAEEETRSFREIVEADTQNTLQDGTFLRFDGTSAGGQCPSCLAIDPYWRHYPVKHPGIVIRSLDCSTAPAVCAATDVKTHLVQQFPTFALYKYGTLRWYTGPKSIYGLEHWISSNNSEAVDDGRQMHRNFDQLYTTMGWVGDDSDSAGSGTGSTLDTNAHYLDYLQRLLSDTTLNIQSIVDVGCGDFHVMQHVDLGVDQSYHGYDVSQVAIDRAHQKLTWKQEKDDDDEDDDDEDDEEEDSSTKNKKITFTVSEPQQQYERADLIIIKDVLQHLPLADALAITNQLSKFRYALVLNDVNPTLLNLDIDDKSRLPLVPGGYRSLDVQQAPFGLTCHEVHLLHHSLQSTIRGAQKMTCLVVVADQTTPTTKSHSDNEL